MASQASDDSNKLILKLMLAIISAMFIVMTSIGGYTASHLMDKVDALVDTQSAMKTNLAVEQEVQKQRDIRLQNIETFIYTQTGKLKPQKPE